MVDRVAVRVEVFAVEDTSVQVCWDDAPPGEITVTAGDAASTVTSRGGPGGAVVDGLPPGQAVEVTVRPEGRGLVRAGRVTTLTPPPGRRLSRFATFNDLHLGARSFGTAHPIWNDDPADPAPRRCARAGIAEAVAWGAQALVAKGDLTQRGRPHEWDEAARLLAAPGLPLVVIEGNHETKLGAVDGTEILARRGVQLATIRPGWLDLPGVRIVGLPTAGWHTDEGRVDEAALQEAAALTAAAAGGAVVVLHHYPQRFRYQTLYPSGIPAPGSHHLLDTLAAANPATLVVAGHSHRHRWHRHATMVVAETGSTKDFPGSWTGYTVFEGGIIQTSRRILDPSAMAWTSRGRRVLGGVWGIWAPGVRAHRCFTYPWPPRG
ncbi:MAG TPA: metallophosphoesterase [Acidimicrobiales bacterium]